MSDYEIARKTLIYNATRRALDSLQTSDVYAGAGYDVIRHAKHGYLKPAKGFAAAYKISEMTMSHLNVSAGLLILRMGKAGLLVPKTIEEFE